MGDISKRLLAKLQAEFSKKFNASGKIKNLNKKLQDGSATYQDSNELAVEIGKILSNTYKENISKNDLPDGKMAYSISKKVIEPTLKQNYELTATYCVDVQTNLNKKAKLGIRGKKPELNQSRIDGILKRLNDEDYDEIKWILDDTVVNFTQSVVDDSIKTNAEFHHKLGLSPKIVRKSTGRCCGWCASLVGVYDYPDDVPEDVWRRHRYCRCTVDYITADGKRQNVHSKKWTDPRKKAVKSGKNFHPDNN